MMYKQFPSIEIPEPLTMGGWEDTSYRNDVCATSTLAFAGRKDGLVFWVNYENPEQREYPEMSRYMVEYKADLEDCSWEDRQVLYEGDNLNAAMLAAILFRIGLVTKAIRGEKQP